MIEFERCDKRQILGQRRAEIIRFAVKIPAFERVPGVSRGCRLGGDTVFGDRLRFDFAAAVHVKADSHGGAQNDFAVRVQTGQIAVFRGDEILQCAVSVQPACQRLSVIGSVIGIGQSDHCGVCQFSDNRKDRVGEINAFDIQIAGNLHADIVQINIAFFRRVLFNSAACKGDIGILGRVQSAAVFRCAVILDRAGIHNELALLDMDTAAVGCGVVRNRTAVHGKQAGCRCQCNGAAVGSRTVCDRTAVQRECSACADNDRAADTASDITAGDRAAACNRTVCDGQISVLDLKNTDGISVCVQGMSVQVNGQLFAVPDCQSGVVLFCIIILRQCDHRIFCCIVDLILELGPVADIFLFLPFCIERQVSRAALCNLGDNVILEEFVVIPAQEVEAFPCRVRKRDRLVLNRIGFGIVAVVVAAVQFISDFVHHRRKHCSQGHVLRRHGKEVISVFGRLNLRTVHIDAGGFVSLIFLNIHSDNFALVCTGHFVCADCTVCAGCAADRVHRDSIKFRGDQERICKSTDIRDIRHDEPVFAVRQRDLNLNRLKGDRVQ